MAAPHLLTTFLRFSLNAPLNSISERGGKFGFVMPLATLTRRPFTGFRAGYYTAPAHSVAVAFKRPWDLHGVKPAFFPVPASVVFGERVDSGSVALGQAPELWAGRLPTTNASSAIARQYLTHAIPAAGDQSDTKSKYAPRFSEGATMVPRVLVIVEHQPTPALGAGAGRIAIRSNRSPREKKPWKLVGTLTGTVERQFVRPLLIGETLLPYRLRKPLLAIVPWDGHRLLDGADERLDYYQGLASWWREDRPYGRVIDQANEWICVIVWTFVAGYPISFLCRSIESYIPQVLCTSLPHM